MAGLDEVAAYIEATERRSTVTLYVPCADARHRRESVKTAVLMHVHPA
jgi:hypothetical protein